MKLNYMTRLWAVMISLVLFSASTASAAEPVITYSQPEHGSLACYQGSNLIPSGSSVGEMSRVLFVVTPDEGYAVDQWTVDGKPANNMYLSVPNQCGKIAVFASMEVSVTLKPTSGDTPVVDKVKLTFKSNPEGIGVITAKSEGTVVNNGDEVKKGATVRFDVSDFDMERYEITGWTANGKSFGYAEQVVDLEVNEVTEVIVNLKELAPPAPDTYAVTVEVDEALATVAITDVEGNAVADLSKVVEGTELKVAVTPAEDCEITSIKANDEDITESKTFTVNSDVVIKVVVVKAIDAVSAASVKVYPNPAVDYVIIEGVEANAQVAVYSANGAIVAMVQANADGQARIDVSRLVAGNYLVQVGAVTKNLIIK